MSFASLAFLLFLPCVFALHWLGRGARWQNGVLVAASLVFYGWWDWRFCGLMVASALVDYAVGGALAAARSPARRRLLLGFSLVFNLGLLGFFKYFGFFVDSLVLALATVGVDVPTLPLQIILPVGISFYTFQTLSYTLDIYRGQFAPRRDLAAYLSFVTFFPQLVAGPIERASHLLPQFLEARKFDRAQAESGLRLMLWGFVKKMLLADNLGALADAAYASPGGVSAALLAAGTLAFAFQIYCDFSGYSDIAAGCGRLFGIDLMRNFALPYFSASVTEFWRRWHVSMSTWFRDYLYVPLGGGRGTGRQVARNVLLTTLASGLWHGAAWHFVLWGLMHGLLLLGERALGLREAGGGFRRAGRVLQTFTLVTLAWVMFRVTTAEEAFTIYARLAGGVLTGGFWAELAALAAAHPWLVAGVAGLLLTEWLTRERWNVLDLPRRPVALRWALYTLLCWAILIGGTKRVAEFIYFQF
ncbi:MAG: MBOAT family O-acyltransferase [Limisphaerales bacterium]